MLASRTRDQQGTVIRWAALMLATGTSLGYPLAAAEAAGTRAGSLIENTATASYDEGGTTVNVDSNTHQMRVDELIDVTVDWSDPADVNTTAGATGQVLAFQLTNAGNGVETYGLTTVGTIGGDDYDPSVTSIVIDDGDGVYEPGVDTVYVPGSNDPQLNPDQSVTIFVVSTTPGGLSDGDRGGVQLVAASKTGTGTPGTAFTGAGEGGGNAVLGNTGGDGSDDGFYATSAATIALVKSATVADPFGGTEAVPGAIITYTIVANVSGSGSLANLRIADAIPTGTTYRAGTITLGGTGLTDAADADAGAFDAAGIAVQLGTVPGGESRTVTFQVAID